MVEVEVVGGRGVQSNHEEIDKRCKVAVTLTIGCRGAHRSEVVDEDASGAKITDNGTVAF